MPTERKSAVAPTSSAPMSQGAWRSAASISVVNTPLKFAPTSLALLPAWMWRFPAPAFTNCSAATADVTRPPAGLCVPAPMPPLLSSSRLLLLAGSTESPASQL